MLSLYLIRKETGSDGCFGALYDESGNALVRTGEHPVNYLSEGEYECRYIEHPQYGWTYELRGTDHPAPFIQAASNCGDEAHIRKSDLQGVMAVGLEIYAVAGQKRLFDPAAALALLTSTMDGEPFILHVAGTNKILKIVNEPTLVYSEAADIPEIFMDDIMDSPQPEETAPNTMSEQ